MYSWKVTVSHSSIGCIWPTTFTGKFLQQKLLCTAQFATQVLKYRGVMVSSVAWMEWSATSYFLCEAADYECCLRIPSAGWGWKEKRREMEAGWAILMWMTTHWWSLLTIAWLRKWSVFITCHSCLVIVLPLANYLTHIQIYTVQLFTLTYLMCWTHYSNRYAQVKLQSNNTAKWYLECSTRLSPDICKEYRILAWGTWYLDVYCKMLACSEAQ